MTVRVRLAVVLTTVALLGAPAAAQIFTDMTNNTARRAAERLAAKGVIARQPDGRLAPDEPVTRLDMAVFLARALSISASSPSYLDFSDVDQIPPADRAAVAAASVLGIVSPQKIQVRKGTLLYTLSTAKAAYGPDESIELTFVIANDGPGMPIEITSLTGERVRLKLAARDGAKVGYGGGLYVENKTQQGIRRETVARVQITEVRPDGATAEIVEQGAVTIRAGLKGFYIQDAWFEYPTSQFYDFVVRDAAGDEVARWSLNRAFLPVNQPVPLVAGREIRGSVRWRQLDQNDRPVRPGRYSLVAMHTTQDNPAMLSVTYTRGLIPALSDNTFRPKQPVTRADLGVFMVRAMGLELEAARRANEALLVADAHTIPADASVPRLTLLYNA